MAIACRPADEAATPPHANPGPTSPNAATAIGSGPIDSALAEHWRRAGVVPAATADDHQYLRRVTLDVAGRIPTAAEVEDFIADRQPDKRAALVKRLASGDEFAAHWADIYSELLLGGATQLPKGIESGTRRWLQGELAGDASWRAMTEQMLTAAGPVQPDGPAGFVAVHGRKGRVEALTGTTARVFLGLSIQCAQCHDHPLDDRYTQRDFYGLAAYYARTRPRIKKDPGGGRSLSIVDKRRGQMRMPTDRDAPGMRSGAVVEPSFLGEPASIGTDQTRRQALTEAIVDSPLFAKAAVSRVWTQLFGRSIGPRWDDLGAADDPGHPALLDALANGFVQADYDLRWLVSTVVLSDAYTRTSAGSDADATARRAAFAQFPVRPMTTQQMIRSLLVATGRKDDTVTLRERTVARMTQQARKAHLIEHGDDEMLSADAFAGNVPQALFLLGGPLTVRGAESTRATTLGAIVAEYDTLDARLDAVLLTTVGRPATDAERTRLGGYVTDATGDPDQAWADVMHALLLSSEFLSVH